MQIEPKKAMLVQTSEASYSVTLAIKQILKKKDGSMAADCKKASCGQLFFTKNRLHSWRTFPSCSAVLEMNGFDVNAA